MDNDDYSCIKEIEKVVHIILPFSYAGNQKAGLKAALDGWKSQYISSLDGILIDYRKVSFVENAGRLIFEQPQIHYDVKAIFSVFKPQSGSVLKGVVNRISKSHVGCVVHDFINVSIPLLTDFAFNLTKFLILETEILFVVLKLEIHRRVIRIKGEFTKECVDIMQKKFPLWKTSRPSTHHHFSIDDDEKEDIPCSQPSNNSDIPPNEYSSGFESSNSALDNESQAVPNESSQKKRKFNESSLEESGIQPPMKTSTPFENPQKRLKPHIEKSSTTFLDYNLLISSIIPNDSSASQEKSKSDVNTNPVVNDGIKTVDSDISELHNMSEKEDHTNGEKSKSYHTSNSAKKKSPSPKKKVKGNEKKSKSSDSKKRKTSDSKKSKTPDSRKSKTSDSKKRKTSDNKKSKSSKSDGSNLKSLDTISEKFSPVVIDVLNRNSESKDKKKKDRKDKEKKIGDKKDKKSKDKKKKKKDKRTDIDEIKLE